MSPGYDPKTEGRVCRSLRPVGRNHILRPACHNGASSAKGVIDRQAGQIMLSITGHHCNVVTQNSAPKPSVQRCSTS
jgi:hypothetical protein